MTDKYGIHDLIISAAEQKPLDFQAAFDELMVDRIRDSVEDRKIQIAHQMYNGAEEEQEVENDDEFGSTDAELDNSDETSEEE